MRSDLIDIHVRAKHLTDKAILVTADDENDVWLPLAKIELRSNGKVNEYEVTMPEWLAIEKGLV